MPFVGRMSTLTSVLVSLNLLSHWVGILVHSHPWTWCVKDNPHDSLSTHSLITSDNADSYQSLVVCAVIKRPHIPHECCYQEATQNHTLLSRGHKFCISAVIKRLHQTTRLIKRPRIPYKCCYQEAAQNHTLLSRGRAFYIRAVIKRLHETA